MKVERLQPGQRVAQRYVIESLVGQGVMGSVYRVLDEASGETRALKLMGHDLLGDAKLRERFLHEATLGDRIASKHVVRVLDSGTTERDVPFYVMELLAGEDMGRWLEHHPYDAADRVAIARMLLDAITAAHEAKIIHRDLKPENLFLSGAPGAWHLSVLDFGVAKVMREITKGGTTPGLGTPLWTAPEQGKENHPIKLSADVWAIGLIVFRLLADRVYWRSAGARGATPFDLAMEMLREPLGPAEARAEALGGRPLPAGFDAWFAGCVDRDPERRFATAGEAREAFEAMLRGDVAAARPSAGSLGRASDAAPSAAAAGTTASGAGRVALGLGLVVLLALAFLLLRGLR